MESQIKSQANEPVQDNLLLFLNDETESRPRAMLRSLASVGRTIASFVAPSREQALFSLIWVASIVTAGVSLSEGTWMGGIAQFSFGVVVTLIAAAGIHEFLSDCWARRAAEQDVEALRNDSHDDAGPEFRTAA